MKAQASLVDFYTQYFLPHSKLETHEVVKFLIRFFISSRSMTLTMLYQISITWEVRLLYLILKHKISNCQVQVITLLKVLIWYLQIHLLFIRIRIIYMLYFIFLSFFLSFLFVFNVFLLGMAATSQEETDEIHNQPASVPVVDSVVNDAKYVSNTCLMSNLLNYRSTFEILKLRTFTSWAWLTSSPTGVA